MEDKFGPEKGGFRTGKPIASQAREIILNVYRFMSNGRLEYDVRYPIKVTAQACGVSCRTVHRIIKETTLGVRPESPGKRRPNRKPTVTLLDAATKCALRHLIYSMYKEGEVPTAQSLLPQARELIGFKGQKTSIIKVIKSMGFIFIKQAGQKVLLERADIVAWRQLYLLHIKENRTARMPRPVVYVYETVLCISNVPNVNSVKDSRLQQTKFVVCGAGMKSFFVPQAIRMLDSRAGQDVFDRINEEFFRAWFENLLLPNLPLGAFIVLESCPHRNVLLHESRSVLANKTDIRKWLTQNQIMFGPEMGKSELLTVVQSANLAGRYVIDNMAEAQGHKILRLPPNHCDLNPMEFIGAKAKSVFEANAPTITAIQEVEGLWKSAIQQITPTDWDECYLYVENVEKRYCDQDDFFQTHNPVKQERGYRARKLSDDGQHQPVRVLSSENVKVGTNLEFNEVCTALQ